MKILIVLVVLICAGLGAVLRNYNITLKRVARSCDPCDYDQYDSPGPSSFHGSHAIAAAQATSYNQYQDQGYYSGPSQRQLAQGSLRGALGLAAQGQQVSGCRTCGGGNAYSNARSYSGNAVAVSVAE